MKGLDTSLVLKITPRRSLFETLRGGFTLMLFITATLVLFIPFVPVALLKPVAPTTRMNRGLTSLLMGLADLWAHALQWISYRFVGSRVEVRGLDDVCLDASYLVVCNHQGWLDIPVLVRAFNGHIRFPRFFIKYELLWLPVVGFVCWAMDFPFMHRYSRKRLKKHPELKGADVAATARACAKYAQMPATVLNFVEGTRRTRAKHAASKSPYRHLLRPKCGSVAFALVAMRDSLDGVLDVTVAYPDAHEPRLWDYCCGRVPEARVQVRRLNVPANLRRGDYADPDCRHRFQRWLNRVWRDKDRDLDVMLGQEGFSPILRGFTDEK